MAATNEQQKEIINTEQYRRPKVAITFHTEHDDIYLQYNSGENDQEGKNVGSQDLTDSLISFQTKNSLEDDAAAFSVVIAGNYHWDRALHQNDIVTIRVMPNGEGETYPENYNYNVMTGMITEVHRVMGFDSDSMLYQINGKSLVQAFQQYQLGLIQEVQSSLSSMGWLWDTNMDLSSMTSGSGGGSSDGGQGLVAGKLPSSVNSMANLPIDTDFGASDAGMVAFAKRLPRVRKFGMSDSDISEANHYIASLGLSPEFFWGYEEVEDGFNTPISDTYAYSWLNHFNSKDVSGGWKEQMGTTIKTLLQHTDDTQPGSGYDGTGDIGVPTKYPKGSIGRLYSAETGRPYLGQIMKSIRQMGGNAGSGTNGTTGDSSGSGNTNSSQNQITNEMQNSTGVAFWGNDVRTIERELVDRFLPYMRYSYGPKGYGLDHYLYYNDMESWTEYEKLMDSSQFVNFQGSLYDLQQAALNSPFNEMYFDFDYDGKSHLIVRRTPFDPIDWEGEEYTQTKSGGKAGNKISTTAIPRNYITSSQVINGDISTTSDQIYSVFNVNPAIDNYTGITNAADLGSLPQFNQNLVNLYGYSVYDMNSLYLGFQDNGDHPLANPNGNPKGKKSKDAKMATVLASQGTDYNARDINRLLGKYKKSAINQRPNTYAQKLADAANNISGNQASKIITNYLSNSKVTQTGVNGILNTANGGGQPSTGSEGISYENWLDIANLNANDNKSYYKTSKRMFNNADDEVLGELKSQFNQNGDKMTNKQFNSILKEYKVAADTIDVGTQAQDLQFFTAKLYNWYCENINFYSGDLTVKGSPEYRIGTVLVYDDEFYGSKMECYVESVEHVFSLTDGYQTTLGLTRGLDNDGADRFTHLWGKHQDFLGGYMGEASLLNLAYATNPKSSGKGGNVEDDIGGSGVGVKAANFGMQFKLPDYTARKERYLYGSGHTGGNQLTSGSGMIILDCSSFVSFCFDAVGAHIGMQTTHTFPTCGKFKRVSKPAAGDIVLLNTEGSNSHVVFYIGNGNSLGWNGGDDDGYGPHDACRVLPVKDFDCSIYGYYRYTG